MGDPEESKGRDPERTRSHLAFLVIGGCLTIICIGWVLRLPDVQSVSMILVGLMMAVVGFYFSRGGGKAL